jgi:hypothetical protein
MIMKNFFAVLVVFTVYFQGFIIGKEIYPYKIQVYQEDQNTKKSILDTVVMGVSYMDDFRSITMDSCKDEDRSLFCFISSLIPVYRGFSKKEDLDKYTHVVDIDIYKSMWNDEEIFERIKSIYNNTKEFEYCIGWFIGPVDFIAILKRKSLQEEEDYFIAMPFTLREGRWKILSGVRLSQPDAAFVLRALMYPDKFSMNVSIASIGDIVFELQEGVESMF